MPAFRSSVESDGDSMAAGQDDGAAAMLRQASAASAQEAALSNA